MLSNLLSELKLFSSRNYREMWHLPFPLMPGLFHLGTFSPIHPHCHKEKDFIVMSEQYFIMACATLVFSHRSVGTVAEDYHDNYSQ